MRSVCSIAKRVARLVAKSLGVILLVALLLVVATSISPIYRFEEPTPFHGDNIFNPYRNLDTAIGWKRANFHTHTRVTGPLNECDYWPDEVLKEYERYGYDIVTFSNHNKITEHPEPALQVNLYEHGYNILKYHKLVFGSDKVMPFDHLLPLLASQKQWQLSLLSSTADIIQINHPLRSPTLNSEQLAKLQGYRLMELDSGKSTENSYWDSALSAGHYSFGLAGDDLHYPDRSRAIAVRCNMLNTPSAKYSDMLNTLRDGAFYAMRVPDYGDGDWATKERQNREIPRIESIGTRGDTIYISLTEAADSIRFTSDGGRSVATSTECLAAQYVMRKEDSYVRITAFMPNGEVIYSNPFARYNATVADTPFVESMPEADIPLTLLFNLALLMGAAAIVALIYRLIKL